MKRHILAITLASAVYGGTAGHTQSPQVPVIAPAPHGSQMRDVLTKLSPQGQQIFHDEWLATEHAAMIARKNAARAAEDAVFETMAAEPFNASALRHAYDVQRQVSAENQRQRHEHLVKVLSKLSIADRQTLVTQLRAMRGEHGSQSNH